MTGSERQDDPSMEEILASIRRIIAEEDEGVPRQPSTLAPSAPSPESAAEQETSQAQLAEDEDDILELTEMVDENGNVISLRAPTASSAPSEPEGDPFEPPAAAQTAADRPDSAARAESAAMAGPQGDSGSEKSLLEADVEARTVAALRAAQMAPETEPAGAVSVAEVPAIEPSPEDLRAVMAPMVKEWLDANLPALVERVVREEVSRLVAKSRPE